MPEWTTFLPVYVSANWLRVALLRCSQWKAHKILLQQVIVLGEQNQGKLISATPSLVLRISDKIFNISGGFLFEGIVLELIVTLHISLKDRELTVPTVKNSTDAM